MFENITAPGACGDTHIAVAAYTGADALMYLLPREVQLWLVARKIRRAVAKRGIDVKRLNYPEVLSPIDGSVLKQAGKVVTFSLPDGLVYRLTQEGAVPFHPEP